MSSSTFQYVLMVIFGFVGIFGILIFAGIIPLGGTEASYGGSVTLWGNIDPGVMDPFVADFNQANQEKFALVYEYHSSTSLENDLVSALASGKGPDLIILPQDLIVRQGDKIAPIPYASLTERDFRDTFADVGSLYLGKGGVFALPLYADPVVMYWNKDLFSNASLSSYPKTWVEFLNLPAVLTKKDNKGNIFQSAVSIGTYKNVTDAKSILATLFLQAGEAVVERRTDQNGALLDSFVPVLGDNGTGAESALTFYTEFANQAKDAYSWNSAMQESKKAFESGIVAVYFGHASEYQSIKRNSPHLNFDVAPVPQRTDAKKKSTFANIGGLAALKMSGNLTTAYSVAYALASSANAETITKGMFLPPLRRDLLAKDPGNAILAVFYKSAIMAGAWYDPNKTETSLIFKDMVESVLSGKATENTAVGNARIRMLGLGDMNEN